MIHQKRDLETEIREAVKQRDWAKASEVQAKIDSLESGKSIDSKSTSKNKINSKVTVSYLYFRFKRSDPGHNKAIDLVSYDIHIFTGDFFIGIFSYLKNFNEIYSNIIELFSKIWKGGSITPRYRLFTSL